jgi:DNA-binding NtrC family response regulator
MIPGPTVVNENSAAGMKIDFFLPILFLRREAFPQKRSTCNAMKQILVVGSDPKISQDLDKHLDPKEFKLLVSPHGKGLLTSLANVQPDLVILDLNPADHAGTETVSKIRELSSDLPLIVLSKTPFRQEKESKEKNLAVVPSPVHIEQVALMVKQALTPDPAAGRQRVLLGSVRLAARKSTAEHRSGGGHDPSPPAGSGNQDFQHVFEEALSPIFARILKECKGHVYDRLLSGLEKTMISEVLRHVNHNQVRASQLLGISRNTLRERMKRFDIF